MKGDVALVLEILGLLIFLLIVWSVVSSMSGRSTSLSKIAAGMEIACEKGSYEMNISLPQKLGSRAWKEFYFDTNIDPARIVYYESFFPFNSAGWLKYSDSPPNLVFSVLNETTSKDIASYRNYLMEQAEKMVPSDSPSQDIEIVFVNLVYDGPFNNRTDAFKAKYGSCGQGILCEKYGSKILKKPVPACEGMLGIFRKRGYSLSSNLKQFLSNPLFPSYFASPCSERIELKLEDCEVVGKYVKLYGKDGKEAGEMFLPDPWGIFDGSHAVHGKCIMADDCGGYDAIKKIDSYFKSACYKRIDENSYMIPSKCYRLL